MENVDPNDVNSTKGGKLTIVIEGNIGSGKSTFLNSFSHLPDVTLLAEPVQKWTNLGGRHNLLELVYQDPRRWNMAFQSYVQLTRLQMHTKPVSTRFKMMERSLYSARYCFVQNYINTGLITECEHHVVDEWFSFILETQKVSVDLVVYLRTDPSVALERIHRRSRNEERSIQIEYLETLHRLHDDWLRGGSKFSLPAPVVELDANKAACEVQEDFRKHLMANVPSMKYLVRSSPQNALASSSAEFSLC